MSRKLKDVIKGRSVVTVGPDTSVRKAAALMKEQGVGSLVVVEGGRMVGIFTERDALFRVVAAGIDPDKTSIQAVMTTNVTTVTAETTLTHALHLMHDCGFRHLPVQAEKDQVPSAVVSLRDAIGDELVRFGRELAQKEQILAVR